MALGSIQQMVDYRDAGMALQPLLAKGETGQPLCQHDFLLIHGAVIGEYESQGFIMGNGGGRLPSGVKDEANQALTLPFNQGLSKIPAGVRNTR